MYWSKGNPSRLTIQISFVRGRDTPVSHWLSSSFTVLVTSGTPNSPSHLVQFIQYISTGYPFQQWSPVKYYTYRSYWCDSLTLLRLRVFDMYPLIRDEDHTDNLNWNFTYGSVVNILKSPMKDVKLLTTGKKPLYILPEGGAGQVFQGRR